FVSEFTAGDMRWLVPAPEEPFDCAVRIRHSRALAPARALPLPGGRLRFTAAAPLRSPTPGQAAAVYVGSQVLGGGFLLHDTKDTN
ncbi:MAG TPA: tRNA 2-thiouridine(34) synthase MnmA, partial [Candidatus Scatomorpha merdavium]|nr:tRNA 2-thiouridine(34) synthase MnmA [Candidatus Scatomorpha merdavium]